MMNTFYKKGKCFLPLFSNNQERIGTMPLGLDHERFRELESCSQRAVCLERRVWLTDDEPVKPFHFSNF